MKIDEKPFDIFRLLQPIKQSFMDVVKPAVRHNQNKIPGFCFPGKKFNNGFGVGIKMGFFAALLQISDQLFGGKSFVEGNFFQ